MRLNVQTTSTTCEKSYMPYSFSRDSSSRLDKNAFIIFVGICDREGFGKLKFPIFPVVNNTQEKYKNTSMSRS